MDLGSALSNAFAMPVEEDSAPINMLAGALGKPAGGPKKKGELEESPHLLAVRAAVAGLRDGSVTPDEYHESISTVQVQISELLGLFEMAQVKRELARASESDQQLAERTRQGLEVVEQGLDRLLGYLESEEMDDMDEGLALVESGYLDLDRTQDDALLEIEDDDEDEEDD